MWRAKPKRATEAKTEPLPEPPPTPRPASRGRVTLDGVAGFTWRALVVGLGVIVVILVLSRLRLIVLPVIIALLLTTVLGPPVEALVRRRLPRLVATFVVVLGSLGLLTLTVVLLAPSVRDQFSDLGPTLAEGRDQVEDWLVDGPLELSRSEIDRYTDQAVASAQAGGGTIASGVLTGAVLVVEIIAGLLLTIVLLFFFVKDGAKICHYGLCRLRVDQRDLARSVGRRAWRALGGYVRGTALIALVDAVIIGIGIAIIGVPLVLPLAILTFLGAFFPLVGAVVAGLLAVLVALVSGGIGDALLVLGVVVIVQQVEGDVLAPLVLGRAVRLHPVVILVALTAGAILGGLAGAFLAVPVTAVIVAVGAELRANEVFGPLPEPEPEPA